MSQCNAYELLYWDTDRDCVGWKQTIGRQLADDQREFDAVVGCAHAREARLFARWLHFLAKPTHSWHPRPPSGP